MIERFFKNITSCVWSPKSVWKMSVAGMRNATSREPADKLYDDGGCEEDCSRRHAV